MKHELWSKPSRSILAAYETQTAAIDALREAIERHGAGYVSTLALVKEDTRGRSKPIAEGRTLVELALAESDSEPAPAAQDSPQ